MSTILKDLSTPTLLTAMENNIYEGWTLFGQLLDATIHDEPELLWFTSGLPFQLGNGIMRAHFTGDKWEKMLSKKIRQLEDKATDIITFTDGVADWAIDSATKS